MRGKDQNVSLEWLRRRFAYAAVSPTGLIWLPQPLEAFPSVRIFRAWNTRFAGKPAGTKDAYGYWETFVLTPAGKHGFKCHRIVWALMTGVWPEDEIDHIDGSHGNNCFENLREATRGQNLQNTGWYRNNTTGYRGVWQRKDTGKFVAEIHVHNRKQSLGQFDSAEEAHRVYLDAKAKLHEFQPIPRHRVLRET
jgi:hypothetical protein